MGSPRAAYYWNVVTGETSRTAPGHVVGFEAPSGHKYYVDPETQQPTWEAPAQAAWKEGHVRARAARAARLRGVC